MATSDNEGTRQLRILVTMLHPGYVRNYEEVFRLLLSRGHRLHLAFLHPAKQARDRVAERLAEEYPTLTITRARKPKRTGWRSIKWTARVLADFARYLHPRYREATELRARVVAKIMDQRPSIGAILALYVTLFVATLKHVSNARLSDFLVRFFLRVYAALPTTPEIDRFVESFEADMLLTTPHVSVGSHEPEYLKSAQRLGLRTGLAVASWDNLSNKGVVKSVPDRVLVWNEIQRDEAVDLHGIPSERVVLTGAQRFDDWFEQRPTWSRDEFCTRAGLDPRQPFLLYVCSSPFIAAHEVPFVVRFLKALRSSGHPALERAGVLVRPHPQNAKQWLSADLSKFDNVSIWPRAGEQPVDTDSRAVYYDSIHHSGAVVGINTSAQVEAGIIGRTVHTVLDPAFKGTQEGTLHFHYLLAENGGLLHVAADMEALTTNLNAALTGELEDGQTARFVDSFVRPLGRDVPGTPVVAQAIEEIGSLPAPARLEPTFLQRALTTLLTPLAWVSVPLDFKRVVSKGGGLRARLTHLSRRSAGEKERGTADAPASEAPEKRDAKLVKQELRAIQQSKTAVVVGPWMHGVSAEILYWIPFLRWATDRYRLEPDRLIAVSRGGVGSWYRGICDGYVDVLDLVDLDVYRRRGGEGLKDSSKPSALERIISDAVRDAAGGSATSMLSPRLLHRLFRRYWAERASMRFANGHMDVRRLVPPTEPELESTLPAEFVALQFSFGRWFPDSPQNRQAVRRVVDAVAQQTDVVLLGPELDGDGAPAELALPEGQHGVIHLLEDLDAARSLHAQSVAISKANGFIGTYGGLSHVALGYGVDVLSLYSDADQLPAVDLDTAYRLAGTTLASLTLVDAARLDVPTWIANGLVSSRAASTLPASAGPQM